jgi:hypothetical protein
VNRTHRCDKNHRGAHGQGTHSCYSLCGCRCWDCCAARSEYERQRRKANAYGRSLTVDAEPVRQHVRNLMCDGKRGAHHKGVGLKRIVKVSGVAQGTLWKLMYGAPDRDGPSKKVRRVTAEKLLAVTPDDMADGATVPSGPTRRKLDEMVAGGFAKAELGRYLTGNVATKSLQVATARRVTVGTARKVDDLHARWKAGEIVPRGRSSRHEFGPPSPFPQTVSKGWVRCEECGGPPLAGGRWCLPCFQARAVPRPRTGCGTDAGYTAHRRRGERPCAECRFAHSQRREVAA